MTTVSFSLQKNFENRKTASLLNWRAPLAGKHYALAQNTNYGFADLFYQLLQFPLFQKFIDNCSLDGVHDSRPVRNLAILSQLLTKFEYLHNITVLTPPYLDNNIRNFFNQFLRFLMAGGLDEFEDMSEYAPGGCVSFMTIHQAKGLEFPVVIVDSLEATPRKSYTPLDEVLQNNYYRKSPFERWSLRKPLTSGASITPPFPARKLACAGL